MIPEVPGISVLPACGFKEWSLVCDALGAGAQSLILRKGGIHEGRGGFWWKHDRFFLFPTHFHEQRASFRWGADGGESPAPMEGAGHRLTLFAEVVEKTQLTEWERVEALRPWHYWTEEAIRERFDYTEQAGISVAVLRVWRLAEVWEFPDEAKFGGCRSWLDLPEVPEAGLVPVLDDAAHGERMAALRSAMGQA
jgi:hypothetical protein